MSAILNPASQLTFTRPFNRVVKKNLTVTNPHEQPIAFKVKTTAPKLYCVRPNSGRIEPGQSIDVSVLLQIMREEPPTNVKCKDKFLVQSTFITPARETKSVNDLWTVVDDDEESKIHQQKIKVVYLPPEGEDILHEEPEHPSTITSDGDISYATVRQTATSSNGTRSIIPEIRSMPAPLERDSHSPPPNEGEYIIAQEETTHHETTETIPIDQPATVPKPSVSGTGVVDPPVVLQQQQQQQPAPSSDRERVADRAPIPPITTTAPADAELHARYEKALNEITRLQSLLAAQPAQPSTGIRRRTTRVISEDGATTLGGLDDGASDDGTLVESVVSQADGVPVQVVAIIAVGVFIATYLFF